MPARLTSLNTAVQKGLEQMKPAAGVKQIEVWDGELENLEVSGVKGLHTDLQALKKALEAGEPDGGKIKTLLAKIGGDTTRIAGRVDNEKVAEQLKTLGEQLTQAGG